MNIAACALRIAQCTEQMRNPLQTELRGLNLVSESVQELNRFGVVHAARALLRANMQRPSKASNTVPPMTFQSRSSRLSAGRLSSGSAGVLGGGGVKGSSYPKVKGWYGDDLEIVDL